MHPSDPGRGYQETFYFLTAMANPPHLLHVFSTFAASGPQLRIAATINHLGNQFRHSIIAMDGIQDGEYRLDGSSQVDFLPAPLKKGSLFMGLAFRRLLKQLKPDLVLSYNWGAMDAVLGAVLAGCPVIHNEAGFGPDEAVKRKARRVLARRVLLRGAYCTVVPSKSLLNIAREEYRLPESKVRYIVNGVDTAHFSPSPERRLRQEWGVDDDTIVFGFVGLLRAEKNLDLLLRAFASAEISQSKLVLVGDGPCREPLQLLCLELGIGDKVIFVGTTRDTLSYYLSFDVFVMSSITEQMPMAMVEAMACSLPVIATDVGDTKAILSPEDSREVIPSNDSLSYSEALRTFALEKELRNKLGLKNRARSLDLYTFNRMADGYGILWRQAIGNSN